MRLFSTFLHRLLGREKLIKEVASLLTISKGSRRFVLLHGPHGVGKTSVMRATAAQLREIFKSQHYFLTINETSLLADIRLFLSYHGQSPQHPRKVLC